MINIDVKVSFLHLKDWVLLLTKWVNDSSLAEM